MASVKEILIASMGYKFPDATVTLILEEHGLASDAPRELKNTEQTKAMDLSRAALLDFLITQPKTVRELDYQITQQDADALVDMRKRILAKWGIVEGIGDTGFVDLSNTH